MFISILNGNDFSSSHFKSMKYKYSKKNKAHNVREMLSFSFLKIFLFWYSFIVSTKLLDGQLLELSSSFVAFFVANSTLKTL
jgi:hypothetical protein